jgi:hypothetical protein
MAQSQQAQDQASLCARLGGVYSIATVVDDFIDRVMSDPRLNANPQIRCAGPGAGRDQSSRREYAERDRRGLVST